MASFKEVFLTPGEVKSKVLEFIESNKILESRGMLKNAVNFVGLPGIAKTSAILQVCHDNNIGVEKVNMANIDDLGEITGYPIKEYHLEKDGETTWVNDKTFDLHISNGYKPTGQTRTGYAEPKWVNNLKNFETSILLLDDCFRSHQRFMNAIMDLIQRGEYYGWKLPKGCNIMLTNNPSDGSFQVSVEDDAQKSRYFTFWVKYDKKDWAAQAEKEGVPGPFINFILKESDQLFSLKNEKDRSQGMKSMPRQWSMLFNSLLNIKGEYTTPSSLYQIQQNGKAILPEEFISVFTQFLHAKDWKMVDPEEIFNMKLDNKTLLSKLKECVGEMGKDFKSAQASILSIRVVNYIHAVTATAPFTSDMVDRLKLIMENKILGEDLSFKVLRDLFAKEPKKFSKIFEHEFFRKQLTS